MYKGKKEGVVSDPAKAELYAGKSFRSSVSRLYVVSVVASSDHAAVVRPYVGL